MDFNDVFRSFFGSFGPRGSSFMEEDDEFDGADFFGTSPPSDFHGNRDDDDDDDMTFGGGHGGSFPPHGGDFFFRFEEDTRNMFSHFEEMFKNFGGGEFPPSVFSGGEREAPPSPLPSSPSKHRSPRDLMLKHPDSDEPPTPSTTLPDQAGKDRLQGNPSSESPSWFSLWTSKPEWQWTLPSLPSSNHREDKDIDEQVKGRKLDEILTQRDPSSSSSSSTPSAIFRPTPTIRSFSKSISIQTVRKPDGTVEQRRTESDGDGNVTTTVTSTNPNEERNSHALPSCWRSPPSQGNPTTDLFRSRIEDTPVGQAKTDSIFKKLFGPWSRDGRW